MMQWNELFNADQEPTEQQITEFISSPLWHDLANHLIQTYQVKPKSVYSGCSMGDGYWKGWNIKFKKAEKRYVRFIQKKVTLLRWSLLARRN